METVIAEWPVSVLGISSDQRPPSGLPADTTVPRWTMLLPSVHGAQLWISDVITDARGVASIVEATEETDLGWRLNIRRATT